MRHTSNGPWVGYPMTHRGQQTGNNVVFDQAEWDALELAQPGVHTFVMAGITNKGEAERHARAAMPTLADR